jgi:apolipoprotein N-acyltransferase
VSAERQALLDAVPLLVFAAVYGWAVLAAILLALAPAFALVLRRRGRAAASGLEVGRQVGSSDAAAVSAVATALAGAEDELAVGRIVADEVTTLLGVDFAAVALVD